MIACAQASFDAMNGADNVHSRVVGWLKILLPLAALALLSTLFLFSRGSDPTANLPFSETELNEIARQPLSAVVRQPFQHGYGAPQRSDRPPPPTTTATALTHTLTPYPTKAK